MMSAAHALIEMPTECGSTTARNGQQYLDVLPTNPLAISLDEGSSSRADEIGNLERRRGHWGTSSSNVTHIYIKTAGRSLLRSSCVASAAGRLRPNAAVFTNGFGIVGARPTPPFQSKFTYDCRQNSPMRGAARDSSDDALAQISITCSPLRNGWSCCCTRAAWRVHRVHRRDGRLDRYRAFTARSNRSCA